MRKANVAKISLLIFMTEPSIWRLRHGARKFYITYYFLRIYAAIFSSLLDFYQHFPISVTRCTDMADCRIRTVLKLAKVILYLV